MCLARGAGMDSSLGRLFVAAPSRTPSVVEAWEAAADVEPLAPCFEALRSTDGAVRLAAMTVLTHWNRPELWSRIAADPRGWHRDEVRAVYRAGLLTWAEDPEVRSGALQALAEDIDEATGLERAVLYGAFMAVLDPTVDPGPIKAQADWGLVEPYLVLASHRPRAVDGSLVVGRCTGRRKVYAGQPGPDHSYRQASAIVLGRQMVLTLSELMPILDVALRAVVPSAHLLDELLREGLGVSLAELANVLRQVGARLLAVGDAIADGSLPVASAEEQWSLALTTELEDPLDLAHRREFLALSQATEALMHGGEFGDFALEPWVWPEVPLFVTLGEICVRRADQASRDRAGLEARLAFAVALAGGLGPLAPLDGAVELAVAELVGLPPPWTSPPKGRRRKRLRRAFAKKVCRVMGELDPDAYTPETWESTAGLLRTWLEAHPSPGAPGGLLKSLSEWFNPKP